jgi:hypothetical protein
MALALEVFQRIARGVNRVGELVKPKDFARGREDVPMRFELEANLGEQLYHYQIAFDFPKGFRELRVAEEMLSVSGDVIFAREEAQVTLGPMQGGRAEFRLDWHMAALPIVQERTKSDPLFIFKQWLSQMIILRPIPALITGESDSETLTPGVTGEDFGAWFSGLLAHSPASYGKIDAYLRGLLPDLKDIKNPTTGKNARSLEVQFSTSLGSATFPFADLSDGEKCFMICALVLAAHDTYGPLTCFWDEPDNYLALSEVGHFVVALRKGFQSGGQFISTSHNPEAIRRFSHENTHLLYRENHLEPSKLRTLKDLDIKGDLIPSLICGDLGS